jgi:uncharacterized protein (TIGR03000 family)
MLRKCFLVPVLATLALLFVVDLAQAQGLRGRRVERRSGMVYDPYLNSPYYQYNQSDPYNPYSPLPVTTMTPGMEGLAPTVQTTTNARISFYPSSSANLGDCAQIRVIVPDVQAKVLFDGKLTTSTGKNRLFDTPPLPAGSQGTYTIRCTWMENGQQMGRDLTLPCSPNGLYVVDFTAIPAVLRR